MSAASRERGATMVEFVGASIVIVLAMLTIAQVAVWIWSRNVAISAAHEGARNAAETGRPLSDGQTVAAQIVRDGVGSSSSSWRIVASQSGSEVAVVVQGESPQLIPILPSFPISARAIALDEDLVFAQ